MPDEETAGAQDAAVKDLPPEGSEEITIKDGDGTMEIPARYGYDRRQLETIRATVASVCSEVQFLRLLEIATRFKLDPFTGQISAAIYDNRVQILVSRDGLLAHAEEHEDFVKMTGDVVRKEDTFEVEWNDGEIERLVHSYKGFEDRGDIVGAWAMVERRDRGKIYFFAPFDEYKGDKVWKKNPSAMILKVPESYALRKAYAVSGVVGEEEVMRSRADLSSRPQEPEWGDDDVMAQRLQSLFERANEVAPGSYRPQKVRTLLAGADAQRRAEIATELENFIERESQKAEAKDEGGKEAKKKPTSKSKSSSKKTPAT